VGVKKSGHQIFIFLICDFLFIMEHKHRYHERNQQTHDDIKELGHEAIKGVVTVGSVAITENLMGSMLGAFPKP